MKSFFIEPDARTTSTNGITVEKYAFTHPCPAEEMHIHSSVEVLYITRGTLEIITNSSTFTLHAGELLLFKKYAIHAINVISDDGCEYYMVKFHMSILNDFTSAEYFYYYYAFLSLDGKSDNFVWHRNELSESTILTAINEIIETYTNEGIYAFFKLKLCVGAFILAMTQDYYNRSPEQLNSLILNEAMARTIKKAIEFINVNYNKPITAADAAKAVGLSYNYFSNCFSKATGKTFTQYLNKVRINHAKYQLLIAEKTISTVAEFVGFETPSYFAQEFRRQMGMTPSEFIKKNKRTRPLD